MLKSNYPPSTSNCVRFRNAVSREVPALASITVIHAVEITSMFICVIYVLSGKKLKWNSAPLSFTVVTKNFYFAR